MIRCKLFVHVICVVVRVYPKYKLFFILLIIFYQNFIVVISFVKLRNFRQYLFHMCPDS